MKICSKLFTIFVVLSFCISLLASCMELPSDSSGEGSESESSSVLASQSGTSEGEQEAQCQIKNIVLIVGDGMGLEHMTAGELYIADLMAFTDWQSVSVNTDSVKATGLGPVLTDSAAAATAMATGSLTVNGYVGKDHYGSDLQTILDAARAYGKSTGIVTTDALFGATPGAFSGHVLDRSSSEELILSQLSSEVDLLCGDAQDLCAAKIEEIALAGYTYCDSFSAVDGTMYAEKAYWQLDLGGIEASVALRDVSVKALDYLDQDTDGFVLLIEQAHIDKYSHSNDFGGMVESIKSLNDTVNAVLQWLGDRNDTAILVTADHETGGLKVGSEEGSLPRVFLSENGDIYYNWATGGHTNANVMLFVYGIRVNFSMMPYYYSRHLIKNTDIYELMYGILSHPDQYT